jgi:histidine triad (HIT) family protein
MHPLQPGHVLVVPKRHATGLSDVSAEDWAAVSELGRARGVRLRDRLAAEGTTLMVADGSAAEPAVFHLHLHVIPRKAGDALDLTYWWEPRARRPSDSELAQIARRICGP